MKMGKEAESFFACSTRGMKTEPRDIAKEFTILLVNQTSEGQRSLHVRQLR